MRTLLIGCGEHGGQTLLPAALSAGLAVTALIDADHHRARALARQWSIPDAFPAVDDVDPHDFDAVIIALPIVAQAQHLDWALRHRLHTFVEKPPAPDLTRLRELTEQARTADVTCCVGMNFRWAEGILKLLATLDGGRFGEISYARVFHIARKPIAPFSDELSLEASLFHAQGIHAIDLVCMLMPGAIAVSGQMVPVDRGRLCVLAADNPATGRRFEANFGSCAAGFYHQLDLITSTGDLLQLRDLSTLTHLPSGADALVGDYPGARVLWRRSPIGGGYHEAGYAPELAAFKRRVDGDQVPRLAALADLLPAYQAFDELLHTRGLKWTL